MLVLVAGALGSSWIKQYCLYHKESKKLSMQQYVQTLPKVVSIFLLNISISLSLIWGGGWRVYDVKWIHTDWHSYVYHVF